MRRVGVLGGTFDPIHIGHLAAAEDAAHILNLDAVLFVPNRIPPHKMTNGVTRMEDRVAMVKLAIADNPRFELSTVELERAGPSYTIDTLRELQANMGADTRLFFLVGCDALPELHTWRQPEAILQEFQVVVMERPGGSPVDWPAIAQRFPRIQEQVKVIRVLQLEISSRDLRRRVAEGRPIRYYVLPQVEMYIAAHTLYRD